MVSFTMVTWDHYLFLLSHTGIIYCFSRKDAEQVTLDLCQLGIRAGYYHADVSSANRRQVHRQWLNNTIQVI